MKNGETEIIQKTAEVWASGKDEYMVDINMKNIIRARLVPGLFPDKYANNNSVVLK